MTGSETLIFAAISTGLSVASEIGAGMAAQAQADFERQQIEANIEINEIDAMQQENDRLVRLRRTFAAQQAAAATQGFSIFDSPSADAISRQSEKDARRDIRNIRFMGQQRSAQLSLAAQQKTAEGRSAFMGGIFGAVGAAGSFAQSEFTFGSIPTDITGGKLPAGGVHGA